MTHEEKISALDAVLQPVIANGFKGMIDVLAFVLNTAMRIPSEQIS